MISGPCWSSISRRASSRPRAQTLNRWPGVSGLPAHTMALNSRSRVLTVPRGACIRRMLGSAQIAQRAPSPSRRRSWSRASASSQATTVKCRLGREASSVHTNAEKTRVDRLIGARSGSC